MDIKIHYVQLFEVRLIAFEYVCTCGTKVIAQYSNELSL